MTNDPGRDGLHNPGLKGVRDVVSEEERPAEVTLEPGLERRDEVVVDGRLLTDVGGTIGSSVLSTPAMVGLMERSASILAYQHLPQGKATVGFEVCIKHVAAAAEGAAVTVSAKLREVAEERKLRFEVEVAEGERTVGVGTHERRLIDVGQLGS